jgi:hypothetical protein
VGGEQAAEMIDSDEELELAFREACRKTDDNEKERRHGMGEERRVTV